MDLRVAAYAVVSNEDAQILLAHWNDPRVVAWSLPGGGLEPGEHPAETVVREVEEETGYEVTVDALLGVESDIIAEDQRSQPNPHGPLQTLRILYRATVIGGSLRHEVNGSTDQAAWFSPAQVATLDRVPFIDGALRQAGVRA
ncbi:MAG: NUDIX domain-containing protein [Propioniciclava sp.]